MKQLHRLCSPALIALCLSAVLVLPALQPSAAVAQATAPTPLPVPKLPLHHTLKPLSCARVPKLRSGSSTVQTYINFINRSGVRVSMYSLDSSRQRVFYRTLDAGQHYLQATFLTHPWLAISTPLVPLMGLRAGKCLGVFLPARQASNAVIK